MSSSVVHVGAPARSAPSRIGTWYLTGFGAVLVGVLILTTPLYSPMIGLWGGAPMMTTAGWTGALLLARLSVVAGVLIARRRTGWATALVAWPFLLSPVLGYFEWAWWLGLLAIAVLAAVDGWRQALLPYGLTLAVAAGYAVTRAPAILPIGPVTATSPGSGDVWITLLLYLLLSAAAVVIAGGIGAARRSRRHLAAAADQTRLAREVAAVAGERARIARDLHDVVAHHVSLVVVRAESAPYLYPELGAAAGPLLADIASDARGALNELRQVLAVLQRTESTDGPDLAPQPAGADIAGLVDDARAAGQDVVLEWADDGAVGIPAAQGYVAFRAVQEALTNARRHARGATVHLAVTVTATLVRIRAANAVDAGVAPGPAGRGLIGMRERVEALGGVLTVGVDGRAYVVIAELPVVVPS